MKNTKITKTLVAISFNIKLNRKTVISQIPVHFDLSDDKKKVEISVKSDL